MSMHMHASTDLRMQRQMIIFRQCLLCGQFLLCSLFCDNFFAAFHLFQHHFFHYNNEKRSFLCSKCVENSRSRYYSHTIMARSEHSKKEIRRREIHPRAIRYDERIKTVEACLISSCLL
jgi:hypothetical protein